MMQRRLILKAGAALPLSGLPHLARSATPACAASPPPTAAQMAGPFARNEVQERWQLRQPGVSGLPMRLTGRVETVDCQPLQDCTLTFWQADDTGRYDVHRGSLYGYQRSADGTYRLDTIVPGRYPGRVRHLHVRIDDASGRHRLTTQLYFPDEPGNRNDFLFDPALLMRYAATDQQAEARFDFVVA